MEGGCSGGSATHILDDSASILDDSAGAALCQASYQGGYEDHPRAQDLVSTACWREALSKGGRCSVGRLPRSHARVGGSKGAKKKYSTGDLMSVSRL